jgi:hypothetical protein
MHLSRYWRTLPTRRTALYRHPMETDDGTTMIGIAISFCSLRSLLSLHAHITKHDIGAADNHPPPHRLTALKIIYLDGFFRSRWPSTLGPPFVLDPRERHDFEKPRSLLSHFHRSTRPRRKAQQLHPQQAILPVVLSSAAQESQPGEHQ